MVRVEDVVDITGESIAEKEKGKKVLKLANEFFKYPNVVDGGSPENYIPVRRFLPLGKTIIGIWPSSNHLRCYNKKHFPKFIEFANLYEKEIGKLRVDTDYS